MCSLEIRKCVVKAPYRWSTCVNIKTHVNTRDAAVINQRAWACSTFTMRLVFFSFGEKHHNTPATELTYMLVHVKRSDVSRDVRSDIHSSVYRNGTVRVYNCILVGRWPWFWLRMFSEMFTNYFQRSCDYVGSRNLKSPINYAYYARVQFVCFWRASSQRTMHCAQISWAQSHTWRVFTLNLTSLERFCSTYNACIFSGLFVSPTLLFRQI